MSVSSFIKRRWAAHNQRLLNGQLAVTKDAADPGGISGGATEGEGIPGASAQIGSAQAAAFVSAEVAGKLEGGAGGSTGSAQ